MVLFEFARTAPSGCALVAAYEAAGGPGRVTRAEDFGLTIAQLHHIGRYQVLGWLHARDPEARARAHAGVRSSSTTRSCAATSSGCWAGCAELDA